MSGPGQSPHIVSPPLDGTRAVFWLDRAATFEAHRGFNRLRTRIATFCLWTVVCVGAILFLFGLGARVTNLLVVLAAVSTLGLRYRIPALLSRTIDKSGGGSGKIRTTLHLRSDGLQIDDGSVVVVAGWSSFASCRKSADYVLLKVRGRGNVFLPRNVLPPGFEKLLDQHLYLAGTTVEAADPTTPLIFGLLSVLAAALLFFVFCAVALMSVGGPRERIGSCPAGQIAIVTQDSDGSRAVLCQYRLGG